MYKSNEVDKYERIFSDLVNNCSVIGSIAISTSAPWQATFDGQGYIECTMNLAEWVNQIDAGIDANLESFYADSSHEYANFTMVAEAAPPESVPNPLPTDFPIMFYDPKTAQAITPPAARPLLALSPKDNTVVSFGTSTNCQSLTLPLERDYYWWYDLRVNQNSEYIYSPDYNSTNVPPGTTVHCGAGTDSSPLKFWIGEAKLYIGFNPDTGNSFQGTIYGVLVDPTDSKPPLSAISDTTPEPTSSP